MNVRTDNLSNIKNIPTPSKHRKTHNKEQFLTMAVATTSLPSSKLILCSILLLWKACEAWVPQFPSSRIGNQIESARNPQRTFVPKSERHLSSRDDNVVDADFERIDESAPKAEYANDTEEEDGASAEPSSLFDLSFQSDPEFKEMRIPFIDGENYIDGKLAFMAELDGVSYGIAVPFEYVAAITVEKPDGSVQYVSPDDDENEELMQIMAAQLQEHVGEDLKLKRTPRVLTISGPLDQYTKNWETELLPKPVETKSLLDESEESLEFFQDFMKKELGEKEYENTMQGDGNSDDDDELTAELMSLFNVPGLGDNEDDPAAMQELFDTLLDSPEEQLTDLQNMGDDVSHQGVALKLVSYKFPDKKAYSLVQLLQPYALIGKYVAADDDIRFELLTAAEAKLVVPRLENVCREDLEKAGLQLQ
jgi:hypothetical protein